VSALEDRSIPHYQQYSRTRHLAEAFRGLQLPTRPSVALRLTMEFTQYPPLFPSANSSEQSSSSMNNVELDYDILNNPTNLEDFNFTDYYNDFTLFATSESFIDSPFTDANFYPSLDSFDLSQPPDEAAPPMPKYSCLYAGCTESFARQCELTRHEYKHTRPFQCQHCGRAFAEKRRCIQHEQSVHGLATDTDKTKCHLCHYAHVRPDAVKRHLRLKHGVGVKAGSSPSTSSDKSSSARGGTRRKGRG